MAALFQHINPFSKQPASSNDEKPGNRSEDQLQAQFARRLADESGETNQSSSDSLPIAQIETHAAKVASLRRPSSVEGINGTYNHTSRSTTQKYYT